VVRRTDIRDAEFDVVRADGKRFHLMGQAAPLFDENGDVRGSFGVFMDFTERKQLEDKLAKQAAELSHTNQDLREFVSVVSHDLQAPLNAMIHLATRMKESAEGQLDAENREILNFLLGSAVRTKAMFADLLAWVKVDSVNRGSFQPVKSREVLEWALENLKDEIQAQNVEVTYDDMPEILSERVQLAAVFQNLIGNAIKYRGADPPRIHVSAERRDKEWIFGVADNGIGVAGDHREYIFGLFRRLHGPAFPGNGVGLAICKRIVERHGGRIWVESQPNEGAKFYFTIPDASEAAAKDGKVRTAGWS
jgi:light-regulated signal transduction histidine kinase (bacteriophytochrome)